MDPFNGKTYDTAYGLKSKVYEWFKKELRYYSLKSCLLNFFPNKDKEDSELLYIWMDEKGREKGRSGRTPMKVGKAIRYMLKDPTDELVEGLVNLYKEEFNSNFTLHKSKEAEVFKEVYTSETVPESRVEGDHQKSLACSCMRYKFEHLPNHPVEAYASGDCEIWYLKDDKGRIAARTIVVLGKYFNYIYSSRQTAYDLLLTLLKNERMTFLAGEDFKLKAIPYKEGYIVPYVDGYDSGSVTRCGKYIVTDEGDECWFTHTHGLSYEGSQCCCCDMWVQEEYILDGEVYCEGCYEELPYCEYYGERHTQESYSVLIGKRQWQDWCESAWENYSRCCGYDGESVSIDLIGNLYLECEEDGEIYPKDVMVEVDGKWYFEENAPQLEEKEA